MKFGLFISAFLLCSCTYSPVNELDGKILTDEHGKRFKLESCGGNDWRFLEEVRDSGDTNTYWVYYRKRYK